MGGLFIVVGGASAWGLWRRCGPGVGERNLTLTIHAEQIGAHSALLVDQLTQDEDDKLSAQTCTDLMNALWPHGSPEHVGEPDWWRTPLGRQVARSLGRDDAEAVTYSVAAAILGVARGTVGVMVTRGTLSKHPDGGVLRASVLQRIGR